ncbi:MAG: RNA polymerase subunit sigma-70 [Planctomycetota bacterium]|nr:MAG: RNA polymerase subunit sigma-70 [Planctomycetota bacterium]
MPPSDPNTATRLLLHIERDDGSEAEALLGLVSKELHAIAVSFLKSERANHTLQPTALVHEAYLRLIDSTVIRSGHRGRFMSVAARAMRRVLIDHARRRNRQRRGGGRWQRVSLNPDMLAAGAIEVDLLDLDQALERFAERDPRAARVVELRFFAGLSVEEVAEILGVSRSTAYQDWLMARGWLGRELQQKGPG